MFLIIWKIRKKTSKTFLAQSGIHLRKKFAAFKETFASKRLLRVGCLNGIKGSKWRKMADQRKSSQCNDNNVRIKESVTRQSCKKKDKNVVGCGL